MDNLQASCERQGEITTEFVRLNEAKENLHNRIGILLDRLADILRKPEPQPTADVTKKEALSSQLAIDLSSVSATIETDLDKINDVINRLGL